MSGERPTESEGALTSRQRSVLRLLERRGGRCGLVRIARDIAAEGGRPSAERTRRVYSQLYRGQLERLVSEGLVEYRETDGVVVLSPGEPAEPGRD